MSKIPLIVILGQTASGKTALSLDVAESFGGEIVSADSMQVYKYMDIGTAKPTEREMRGIPHHMISEIYPDEAFSVAAYVKRAAAYIADVHARGKLPIVVGGTGLYIDSLVQNRIFTETETDENLRRELYDLADTRGGAYLKNMLAAVDPQAAEQISENNIKRLVRALEIYKTGGKTMSWQNEHSVGEQIYDPYYFAISWDREELYRRIDKRVDIMLSEGLIDEVRALLAMGYTASLNSMQAIGYKETLWYLGGRLTRSELERIIKRDSRRYAKRQLTWFKKNDKIQWIGNSEHDKLTKIRDTIYIPVP